MHDRRSHPPEIQRKKTKAEQRAAPAGRIESSWRRGPRRDCFNPLAFIAAQSIIIVDDLSTSLCSPRPWWSLLAGASAGPAMQTGGDVTQFTPCTHDVMGGVCTGEEGLLPPWRWRHGGGGPKRDAAWLVYSPRLHNALVSGVTGLHCVTLYGESVGVLRCVRSPLGEQA